MTWAERFGDLAANVALVTINLARIFTLLALIAAEKLDNLITALAERGEERIRPTEVSPRAWLHLPAAVLWGIASIILRVASIVTVFVRQAASTIDEFFRVLAEGENT